MGSALHLAHVSARQAMSEQNIFLIGMMAVGKSTVGRQLALALDLPFYDSDHEIERRAGAEIAWIFDVEGESGFRNREEQIIDELSRKSGIVMATGGGVVVRDINRQRLAERGLVVHLDGSIDKLLRRTRRDRKRPLLQGPKPAKTLRDLAEHRAPLYREIADYRVNTDRRSASSVAKQIVKRYRDPANENYGVDDAERGG